MEKYAVDIRHNPDLVKSERLSPGTVAIWEDLETPSVCLMWLRVVP
jgi:hypothetical protein